MTLSTGAADALWQRRRYLAGPSGCGLCGLESLAQAMRQPRRVTGDLRVSGQAIYTAMTMLPGRQTMNRLTGALHAAAFWTPADGIIVVREDVGRHNALDKLTGAVVSAGLSAGDGAVLLTSRVSVTDGAESGVPGRDDPGRRFRADRLGAARREGCRHHLDRGGPTRRFRDLHSPAPHSLAERRVRVRVCALDPDRRCGRDGVGRHGRAHWQFWWRRCGLPPRHPPLSRKVPPRNWSGPKAARRTFGRPRGWCRDIPAGPLLAPFQALARELPLGETLWRAAGVRCHAIRLADAQ